MHTSCKSHLVKIIVSFPYDVNLGGGLVADTPRIHPGGRALAAHEKTSPSMAAVPTIFSRQPKFVDGVLNRGLSEDAHTLTMDRLTLIFCMSSV